MSNVSVAVDDVIVTDELARRPRRLPEYEAESRAQTTLALAIASKPQGALQTLAELVLELCAADSAGISIPGQQPGALPRNAVAGALAQHDIMSPAAEPCAMVMERNCVMLFDRAERHFPALSGLTPRIHEYLLAPCVVDGKPAGTVWAAGHSPGKRFDAEDARLLQSLASFAALAYQTMVTLEQARAGQHELEAQVAGRTGLLSETNRLLQQEVAQRRQAETALRDSQAHLAADLAGMRLLYDLHARLAYRTDLHCALDEILAAACTFTGTERGCVQLVNADSHCLEIVAQRGYGADSPFIAHFRDEGFAPGCDIARVERRRLLIEDAASFPGLVGTAAGAAISADGIRAAQSTPMISRRGETIGVLSTQFRHPHRPSDDQLRLIDLLAWTAADFVERHHAETALRQGQQRQAFLLELNDALRPLTDPIAIQAEASRLLGEHLGANRALIAEFDGDEMIVQRDYVSGLPSMAGRYPVAAFGTEHIKAYQRGEPFIIDDVGADSRLSASDRVPFADAGIAAAIGVGMIRNGEVVAAFGIHSKTPRLWTEAETGLAREVAEHARAALERARAEEALKEADRRKDQFLATLAHELRNPLAPISNAVHLLRRPRDRRTAGPLVEMIGRQVQQIARLVDDLLEISRITRGKIQLDRQAVSLADVVRNAVETSRPLLDGARHRLTVALPDAPVMLEADSARLTQVLTNLLNNAAKYTDADGDIRLSAQREGDAAVISVRDSGIGIPGDQLAHVFEMFTQLHRADGRSQGGLGIGLTMVRDLVRLHEGTVEARSGGPGQGSEFVVRLPVLQAGYVSGDPVAPVAADAPLPDAPLSGQRILVVDDNRDAADSLAMLLEASGAEVHTAYGGDLALATLDSMRPDTILLDLGMPGKDGYEVARQIRQDGRLEGVRIVALTGWGQETDRNRTLQWGFDCHLTKPVDFGELRSWLNGT